MMRGVEGGDACNLECVRRDALHEFVGPVKIVIVDSLPGEHERKLLNSTLLTFANLLMGATVITTVYFSFICKLPIFLSSHIAACTIAFQLLLPSAIMMLNPMFGAATQLKNRERKSQHVYLGHMTIFFGITSACHLFCYIVMEKFPINIHTVTGTVAVLTAIATVTLGPILHYADVCTDKEIARIKKVKYLHVTFAVVSFVASSMCLCSSFLKPTFQKWSALLELKELTWVLSLFCLVYTALILRCVNWQLNYQNTSVM